jgi:hypothetical protein
MELEHGRYVVMSAPLFGAIFAVILYLLFVSGYVSGDLVPKFLPSADSTGALRFREFMDRAQPLAVQDVGKVLIWSFLAGFAERLVPDALDRLVARQQAAETTAASGAIPPRPLAEAVETAGTTSATGATPVAAISAHVREVVPSQDATLPSTDPLVIRFTEPVQEADVALISETGAAIELDAHWNTEMTELRLEHAPLAPGTYTLTLTALYLPDGIELDERAQVTFHIV